MEHQERPRKVARTEARPHPGQHARPRRRATSIPALRKRNRNESGKRPFDIDEMMHRLRAAVKPYTPAAMFQLACEGYGSVFEILIACIISIRTLEEVTLPTARKLFAVARTPRELAKLSAHKIDELIHACTFHEPKAKTIHDIAIEAIEKYRGELPCDFDALTTLHGVGPKCANLTLGVACGQPHGIPVDIHVHRVVNRWRYVSASNPEKTMAELEKKLPRKYWVEINKLLVPFGKFICTAKQPRCSTCPLLQYCRQVGVTSHR